MTPSEASDGPSLIRRRRVLFAESSLGSLQTRGSSMATNRHSANATSALHEAVIAAEDQYSEAMTYTKKMRDRLRRAKKKLDTGIGIAAEIRKLITDLEKQSPPRSPRSPQDLAKALAAELSKFEGQHARSFVSELDAVGTKAGLAVKRLADCYAVGPFLLRLDFAKEKADLDYAKVTVEKGLPLSTEKIVARVADLKAALIDSPVDVQAFRRDLEEALRVAHARNPKPPQPRLRCELPAIFDELAFIRRRRSRKKASHDYPMARFIVELKQFLSSSENLESANPIRPETAVIENTGKASKSVFVPKSLAAGFDEGTYMQAITMERHRS